MTGDCCTLDFRPRGWKASSAYQVLGQVLTPDGRTRWSIGGRWNDKIFARLTPGYEDSTLLAESSLAGRRGDSSQALLVWKANPRPANIPFNLTPFVVTFQALPDRLKPLLPLTDTRRRPDQVAMELGQYDLAATEKERVEQRQRARRREREEHGEEFVPQWFRKQKCSITGEEYWQTTGRYWQVRDAVGRGESVWEVEDIFGG